MVSMSQLVLWTAAIGLLTCLGAELDAGCRHPFNVVSRWSLDVENPDGTPATHTAFEQALACTDSLVLAAMAGSTRPLNRWHACLTGAGSSFTGDLPISIMPSANPDLLELAGHFRAVSPTAGLRVERVQTFVPLARTIGSGAGKDAASRPSTWQKLAEHALLEPILVKPGQVFEVTVLFAVTLRGRWQM